LEILIQAVEASILVLGPGDRSAYPIWEPLESVHRQPIEEVESYERLTRGHFSEFENLHGLGQVLIGVRIARGMTQREWARRMNVDETMVSRDERNEYHGITVERAMRVLDALGVRLVTRVEVEPMRMPNESSAEQVSEFA